MLSKLLLMDCLKVPFLGDTGELSEATGENRNGGNWPSLSKSASVGLSAVCCGLVPKSCLTLL